MAEDHTTEIQRLIDDLITAKGEGERAQRDFDSARDELVARVYERLRRLARTIFHQSFPRLDAAHETGTVHHESLLRIRHSLADVQPTTVVEFFRFSAFKVRQTLTDLARAYDARGGGKDVSFQRHDGSESSVTFSLEAVDEVTPEIIAMWSEIHDAAGKLPPKERDVFDMCFYSGLSQKEAAAVLTVDQATVSRRWTEAIKKLPKLPG